ncbi:MAG: helix-turn-helix domain-containing protein [Vibrio sp.]|uniref:helix-turn-helix domain-containing protein n=1 Tax=Vibrio sp. TaxID=678 RepID=UPI003A8AE3C8
MEILDSTRGLTEKSLNKENNPEGIIPSEQIIPFSERLEYIIGNDSVRSFSRKCGLSEKTLRNYIAAKQYPTLDRLALIAEASGKSISWLATGEDPSKKRDEHTQLNEQVLQNIIQAIEIILEKKEAFIAPAKKAKIITLLYKMSTKDKKIDYQLIEEAIELAS